MKPLLLISLAFLLLSCSKNSFPASKGGVEAKGQELYHDMIVLGEKLDNPYSVTNVRKAYSSLYPTKSRDDIVTTDLYVRFLPQSESEFNQLVASGLQLIDHPVDYEIVREGDWYHDPSLSKDNYTWQYAVVPHDYKFPDIKHEILTECFLAENSPKAKSASDVDWDAVENLSYRLTGNEDMIDDSALTKADRGYPSGRITIVDDNASDGKPFGVSEVRISCNVFVKFARTYTDRDGYYTMPKKFAAKPRYRLVFKNRKGFSIGFNLVLVPASVSTLGKASADGMNYTITSKSDRKLFKRAVVNNAAYTYYCSCEEAESGIQLPPSDLRIWILHGVRASSAVMMHHGTVVDALKFGKYLKLFAALIKYFAPDITIGAKGKDDYMSLFDSTCHELAHASHFSKVGVNYWNKYILYILESYLKTDGEAYGDGTDMPNAGYCEVGEMWAYHVESMMHKERYGGIYPAYGTSYWFYPQIFSYLEDRGMSRSALYQALEPDVISRDRLKGRLILKYPQASATIEQVFSRYN